jgi:hypothetical protein
MLIKQSGDSLFKHLKYNYHIINDNMQPYFASIIFNNFVVA